MARIADYTIITDAWVIEGNQDTIEFAIPSNLNVSSSSILGFMFKLNSTDGVTIKFRLNGIEVWSWNFSDGSDLPTRYFQEVVGGNVLRPGTNVFSMQSSSGGKTFMQISDAVLWIQVNI